MNQAQEEYLSKFCAGKHISREEAMNHVLVRDIIESLNDWHEPVYAKTIQNGLKCNCS